MPALKADHPLDVFILVEYRASSQVFCFKMFSEYYMLLSVVLTIWLGDMVGRYGGKE